MKEETKPVIEYSRKQNKLVIALGYILGAFGTIWAIFTAHTPVPVRIIAGVLYCILLVITCILIIRRRMFGLEGIVRLTSKEKNNYSTINKHIKKAKSTIMIIAYHGDTLLTHTKKEIIEAIKNDVTVKVLISNEEMVLLKEVWDLEGTIQPSRWSDAKRIINEIAEQTKGISCTFYYHEYNTQARYALIVIDGKWAWWTPYHPGLLVEDTTSFILSAKGDASIIHECIKHFNILWNKLEQDEKNKNKEVLP